MKKDKFSFGEDLNRGGRRGVVLGGDQREMTPEPRRKWGKWKEGRLCLWTHRG